MEIIKLDIKYVPPVRTKTSTAAQFIPLNGAMQSSRGLQYKRAVNMGLDSSVIMIPVNWIGKAIQESPIIVQKRNKAHEWENLPDHKIELLLERPNPYYDSSTLWLATIMSFVIGGNAYWLKMRGKKSQGVEALLYLPHWLVTPRKLPGMSDALIDYYEYNQPEPAQKLIILPDDIVHFRHGIDPRDMKLGLSPIESALRDVFSDDECADFTAAILNNMGVPGVIVSPEGGTVTAEQAQAVKEFLKDRFTGDMRGEPWVMEGPTKVKQIGFSPKDLSVDSLRDVPEERVTGLLGIPAAVVGFGTGLQQTKVGATMIEMVKLAWSGCIMPYQRIFSNQLTYSLLPDLDSKAYQGMRVSFDNSKVAALQESHDGLATRLVNLFDGGLLTRAEARTAYDTKLPIAKTDAVYMVAGSEVPFGSSQQDAAPPPPPMLPGALKPGAAQEKKGMRKPVGKKQKEFLARSRKSAKTLQRNFKAELLPFFDSLGAEAARIAHDELKDWNENLVTKGLTTREQANRISKRMDLVVSEAKLKKYGAQHYVTVAAHTFQQVNDVFGLALQVRDPISEQLLSEGGKHIGLVDLADQTRDRLFEVLAESRSEGIGVDEVVRRIRDQIPAGPWADAETRARVIARTETMSAQRESILIGMRESGAVETVMAFDNLIGDNHTDPTYEIDDDEFSCAEVNGVVFSLEEAEIMMDQEHPQGTLTFAPYFDD